MLRIRITNNNTKDFSLIISVTPHKHVWEREHRYLHFADEKTEELRFQVVCILWSSSSVFTYHPADLPPYGQSVVSTRILIAALLVVVENWKQLKGPSIGG